MGLVYLAATRFIRTERQLAAVALAVVAAGFSQALLGYVQFVFQLGPDAFKHGPFLRAYGSFDQPNPYAGFLNMTLPLALCLALHWRSRGLRALGLGAVALILGAIVVSESRGALLAGSLAIAIVLALLSKRAAFVAASMSTAPASTDGRCATMPTLRPPRFAKPAMMFAAQPGRPPRTKLPITRSGRPSPSRSAKSGLSLVAPSVTGYSRHEPAAPWVCRHSGEVRVQQLDTRISNEGACLIGSVVNAVGHVDMSCRALRGLWLHDELDVLAGMVKNGQAAELGNIAPT